MECLLGGVPDADGLCSAGCLVLHENDQVLESGDAEEGGVEALPRMLCPGVRSTQYGGCESGGGGEDSPLGHRVMQVTQHLGGGARRIPGSVWQFLSWFFYCGLMWIASTVVWPWRAIGESKSLPTAEEQSGSISGK